MNFAVASQAQVDNLGVYAFAHSLIDHATPITPTPSNETTVFHWMNDIRVEAEKEFSAGGQFGFLTNHVNLPPAPRLFYEHVTPVWEEDVETFSESKINTILLTAGNFIQYVPANGPYPLDESTTVIDLTETIFDWVDNEIDAKYYIYLNWPEMDLQSAYPPTVPMQSEIDAYHNRTINGFTDWWVEYQDLMLASRPEYNTRLIPVGTIMSKLMKEVIPNEVPFEDYYDDSDPHGKPTLYFLAGAITYMAMYEEKMPSTYYPSDQVHDGVRNNLATICDFIWEELLAFNLPNGESRVFSATPTANVDLENIEIGIFPNPAQGAFNIIGLDADYSVEVIDVLGNVIYQRGNNFTSEARVNINHASKGLYFIQVRNRQGDILASKRIIKVD